MKTRICFSGFASAEMSALQAESGKLESLWECRFVPDAGATRAVLTEGSCDALVVNMSALAADAVALLREAGELQHNPLRFIVGDVDDQSVIINGIGGSHHFVRRRLKRPTSSKTSGAASNWMPGCPPKNCAR